MNERQRKRQSDIGTGSGGESGDGGFADKKKKIGKLLAAADAAAESSLSDDSEQFLNQFEQTGAQ